MYVSFLPLLTLALVAQSTAKTTKAGGTPDVACRRKSVATSSNVYATINKFCSQPTFDIGSDYALKGSSNGGPLGNVHVFVAREGKCRVANVMPQVMCRQLFYQVCAGGDAMGFGTYVKLPYSCYLPTIKSN